LIHLANQIKRNRFFS